MQTNIIIHLVFGGLFMGVLVAGYFLFKNFDKLFGADANCHYQNSGAAGLNKVQAIAIWLHALALTGAFAFFMN